MPRGRGERGIRFIRELRGKGRSGKGEVLSSSAEKKGNALHSSNGREEKTAQRALVGGCSKKREKDPPNFSEGAGRRAPQERKKT